MKYSANNVPSVVNAPTSGVVVTKQVPPYFKGSVMVRFIKEEFGPSKSSGKPQISLVGEIVKPERVVNEFDGKTYDLTSLPVRIYLSLGQTDKNGNPTDNIGYLVHDLLPKLGLPSEIDDENPLKSENNPEGISFLGIVAEVYISAKEKKEQRQLPGGKYEDVTDSRGNPIS